MKRTRFSVYGTLGFWLAGLLLAGRMEAQTAGILREVFLGIQGSSLSDLTNAPNFPNRPSLVQILTNSFEAPVNYANNYGQRLHGFLLAPQTGAYTFWIASDDQSVLFLGTSDDPASKVEIAGVSGSTGSREWDREAGQESAPVMLVAGEIYYIEALMKEGSGSDNLAVRWQLPDGTIEEPMSAWHMFPANVTINPPQIALQPTNTVAAEGATVVFRVTVKNLDPVLYQWQRNGADIKGATFAALTNQTVSVYDNGSRYRCVISNSLGTTNSAEVLLTVIPDRTPPAIAAVANMGTRSLRVVFSEPVLNAVQVANYALDNGATVQAVAATADPRIYILSTSPLALRMTYILTVREITDQSAARNRVLPQTSKSFITVEFTPQDIGESALPGQLVPIANGYQVTAAGRGVGRTNDQFLFSYQVRTNDFDLKIRIQSLGSVNPWTQAGLMAREDLGIASRFAAALATPNISGCYFTYRQTNSGVAGMSGGFPSTPPSTWLRLKRQGDQFSGYASFDGETWVLLGSSRLVFTNAIYVGLAVSSHDPLQLATAELSDLNNVFGSPSLADRSDGYEPLGPSTRRTGLVISEIMYHPALRLDRKELEFLELFNAGPTPLDLGRYRIEGAVDFEFPAGAQLAGGAFLILAKSPADVRSVYPSANVMGPYDNRLENLAGTIRVRNALGAVMLEANYSGEPPWPMAADGAGHSLVLARPSFGEGQVEAWAASQYLGGSPGQLEPRISSPLDRIVINEFLAQTDPPLLDFIELYNPNVEPVDISGCVLTDNPPTPRFVIPPNTVLPKNGFAVFYQDQLGFALDARGETICLLNPAQNRVIEALRFGAQANGVASGRYPNGAPGICELSAPTPGKPNAALLQHDIVINEIMYHPPSSGGSDDEFVELYNKGTNAVAVGGWKFLGGIQFTVPDGLVIPARGYLVIAKNAARLLASHPELDPAKVTGDFSGNLANGGERIALAMPQVMTITNANGIVTRFTADVVVDEVFHRDGGRWGQWTDGGGSSLELVDARSDNRKAANWADSDETAKAPWTTVEHTGVLDHGDNSFGINWLQISLMDIGECLVDDVEVYSVGGQNLAANSTFEGGISDLILRGTHKQSRLQNGAGVNRSRALRVVATARGDTGPNQISIPLTTPLIRGNTATVRAKVRWLRGSPEILFRIRGNFLEAAGRMIVPENLGTPGAPNSRTLANTGPAIFDVQHHPILPSPFEPVLVTARLHDPDGIGTVTLNYRYDPAITINSLALLDNGLGGDKIAGDGIYSAVIPGQPAGMLMAFSVQARDLHAPPATASFPSDAPTRECLVRFGEEQRPGNFGTYRIWFTQATLDEWSSREQGSNEPLDATFVYGNDRVIYNIGALYSGSPWHWRGYNGPTGGTCNYAVIMPGDDLFLGTTDFVLNAPSNLGSDGAGIRERVTHYMAEQMGLPSTYRRFIHVYVNGLRRSFIFEDAQQPSREFVEQWYPEEANGELFKIEDWFEFADDASGFNNVDATLDNFTTGGGVKKQARYRWTWRKRATQDTAHDYSSLFALVDAVNTADTNLYTGAVEAVVDIEQWMRTMAIRHAVGDWDAYGYQRGKNMYAYKTPNSRWVLMNWDISFALGLGDGAGHDIFDTAHSDGSIDQVTERMFRHPPFRRLYLQALQDIMDGPFAAGPTDVYMDAEYQALINNGVSVSSPATIRSWINSRRSYLSRVLATNQAPFVVSFNPQEGSRTNKNLVRLEGTAPLTVKTIEVNGIAYPLAWGTVNGWSMVLPVFGGQNQLSIRGYNGAGLPIEGTDTNITVELLGTTERPQDRLVINEIMYEAEVADAEYVEIHNTSSLYYFDLSGFYFDGIDFVFPPGSLIPPQGFLLVVQNRPVFEGVYGYGLPVAGEYSGRLNNAGETLRLLQLGQTPGEFTVIDEVTFQPGLPWLVAADETGSSLQLLDSAQDNNRPGNWAAVNTNGLAIPRWRYISLTGKASASRLAMSLDAPGEVIIDDISLVAGLTPGVGPNLVKNGGFESPLSEGWTAQGEHGATEITGSVRHAGQGALHLVATGAAGSVYQDIVPSLIPDQYYTFGFWYYPGTAPAELTVQIEGLGLTSQQSAQNDLLARRTPGAPNSVRVALGPLPALWINEVQPQNRTGIADASGRREPWLEIYNASTRALNLTDCFLSDDPAQLMQWAFPTGSMISPGQFVVVWADGEGAQTSPSEWHTGFRLEPSTGGVMLSRMQNGILVVLDHLDYGEVGEDRSVGDYPDANFLQREVFSVSTPGAANTNKPTPILVRINEWMASNTHTLADPADGDFEDWIELHNAGQTPVDLSGFTLTDDLTNPAKWAFPDGTLIPAQGYLLVWADEETRQNGPGLSPHTNFKLSRSGEEIGLSDPGGRLIDSVRFGAQSDDVSEGRQPNGSESVQRLPQPTPGSTNGGGVTELQVVRIEVSPAGVVIRFTSIAGKAYLVQYKQGLFDPAWLNLGSTVVATGTETIFTDSFTSGINQRFYRVIQAP